MNTKFVVYDLTTGRIKRSGECAEETVPFQAQAGEGVIVGNANDATDEVDPATKEIKRNIKTPAVFPVIDDDLTTEGALDALFEFAETLPDAEQHTRFKRVSDKRKDRKKNA